MKYIDILGAFIPFRLVHSLLSFIVVGACSGSCVCVQRARVYVFDFYFCLFRCSRLAAHAHVRLKMLNEIPEWALNARSILYHDLNSSPCEAWMPNKQAYITAETYLHTFLMKYPFFIVNATEVVHNLLSHMHFAFASTSQISFASMETTLRILKFPKRPQSKHECSAYI